MVSQMLTYLHLITLYATATAGVGDSRRVLTLFVCVDWFRRMWQRESFPWDNRRSLTRLSTESLLWRQTVHGQCSLVDAVLPV